MRLVVDTDTASDDAVALIMALRHRDAEVAAVTTVSGNVDVEQGTRNALATLERCGRDEVPVFVGCDRPLVREPHYAHGFHGRDGMGDQGLRPERLEAVGGHAVDALIERVVEGTTLVTLGPLTNVSLALRKDPGLADRVDRCVVMGGTANRGGNITPAAEFNVWADPEAAEIVFSSRLPVEMVGWELCLGEAALSEDELQRICSLGTPPAEFAVACNATAIEGSRRLREGGLGLPDPVAMAVALDPSVATRTGHHHVAVETHGHLTRGMTVVDELDVTGREPNATVVRQIDIPRWKSLLYTSLAEEEPAG